MRDENQLGLILASLRKRRGWNQEQTADWLGVTRHTYSDWERGIRPPSSKKLNHIANKFELSQENEDELYRAAAQVTKKREHLPFPPNPFFTGREKYLERLSELLQESERVTLTQPTSISGLGGIGKTQIALEYAHRYYQKNVYRAVFWMNAADKTALRGSYVKLAEILELPDLNEHEPDRSVQAVKQWLERHTHWLLIMDNADDLELARSYFPGGHRGHILLTTRSQFAGDIGARQLETDKMEPEEGLLFLLRRSRKLEIDAALDTVSADIRETAGEVVALLGGHPLALDQAGAYIEQTGVSFTEYIYLYQKQRRDLLDRHGAHKRKHSEHPEYGQHPETVVATFGLCFTKARERHSLADEILNFCAFCAPDAIPEELFQCDDSFKVDELEFNAGIAALQRYSLITRDGHERTLSMHRLVQTVLIEDMSPDLQKQWRECLAQRLISAYIYGYISSRSLCERLLPHVLACAACTEDELTPTAGIWWVFHMSSLLLYNLGQLSEAVALLERVLSIYEHHLASDNPGIAQVLNDLGVFYANQGNAAEAEPLFQEAYDIWASCLKKAARSGIGRDSFDVIVRGLSESAFNLGVNYLRQDTYEVAELLLRQALLVQKKFFGSDHADTARSMYMLALACYHQGKYDEGGVLAQQAISIWEKTEHPDTALPTLLGALLLHNIGQHEHAETFYQQALQLKEGQLGKKHPEVQGFRKVYEDFFQNTLHDAEAAELDANDEPPV